MPILVDELSVWDISFRWAGYDPRKFYFRIPLEVENNFRNLMDAILSAEIDCISISLEKREYESDEKMFSIYYWIDDIHSCIAAQDFNKKLLKWAHVERYAFMEWCERRSIPLPQFWFPEGWNLTYQLPPDELHPGYWYMRKDWTREQLDEYNNLVEANRNKEGLGRSALRPNQEAKAACQQIARAIWKKEPDRTIASVVKDELIQEYCDAQRYAPVTVREWVREVAPQDVSDRRGRPRKNAAKDE